MATARPSSMGWPLVAADSHRLATSGWENGMEVLPHGLVWQRVASKHHFTPGPAKHTFDAASAKHSWRTGG